MRVRTLIGASLLAGLAATAQATAQTRGGEAGVKEPAPKFVARADRVVCKSDDVTGSRVRKQKICLTNREWDRKSKGGKGFAEELDRDRETTIAPRPPGG